MLLLLDGSTRAALHLGLWVLPRVNRWRATRYGKLKARKNPGEYFTRLVEVGSG